MTNYYTRIAEFHFWPDNPPDMWGYDWHRGEEISYEGKDEFSTDFLARSSETLCR